MSPRTQLFLSVFACSGLLLAACATVQDEPAATPDYAPIQHRGPTSQSRLYADCLDQAIQAQAYGRSAADDGAVELILFSCTGVPAAALYEALGQRSLDEDARWEHQGWSYRSPQRIERDLFGADWCATDGVSHRCAINLNVGWFWPGD